jgi:hypothetical protein
MSRSVGVVSVCLMALAAAGCTRLPAGTGSTSIPQATGSGAIGTPLPTDPAATGVTTSVSEIYVVPAKDQHADGTLYLHLVGSDGSTDTKLGEGTDAIAIPAVAPTASAHAQWYVSASSQVVIQQPSAAATSLSDPAVPLTSLEASGFLYVQAGDAVTAIESGSVKANYPLPTLAPDPSAGALRPYFKGVYSGIGTGHVAALIPMDSGHVLAFTFTGRAAAVTDLMDGRTAPLAGFSRLGSAVRTVDGTILILAWNAQDESQDIRVVELDGTSLTVRSAIDSGVPAAGRLRDIALPGLGHDGVFAIAAGDETSGVRLTLFAVDGPQLTTLPSPPVNSGLTIAADEGSIVYVYGGIAANKVGAFDLAAGKFVADLTDLRSPGGSFVIGILP